MKSLILIPFLVILLFILISCTTGEKMKHETEGVLDEKMKHEMEAMPTILPSPLAYEVDLQYDQPLQANQTVPMRVTVYNSITKKPLMDLEEDHERLLHAFFVRKDLEQFLHLHSDSLGPSFDINSIFPTGGEWLAFVEWKHEGQLYYKSIPLSVVGDSVIIQPDLSQEKAVNNYKIRFETDPIQPLAGQETKFTFIIQDPNGKNISELEPYLGALMHVTVWDKAFTDFAHPHVEKGEGQSSQVHKPDFMAYHTFSMSGKYKIWAQFKHNGAVHTVGYWINVT